MATSKAAESAAAKAKRLQALELHLAGATYQAIADTLGFASKGHAHDAVQKALADLAPDLEQSDATDVARIDAMIQALWSKARRGDVQAIDRVLKLQQERRAIAGEGAEKQPEEPSGGSSKLTKLRAIHGGQGKAKAAG
jgi:hypothetical protein